jgi:hypothetical protein
MKRTIASHALFGCLTTVRALHKVSRNGSTPTR